MRRRLCPDAAVPALTLALIQADPNQLAHLLLAFTQSPAHLYASLGDGTWYSEGNTAVQFRSQESAALFHSRFPKWRVHYECGKCKRPVHAGAATLQVLDGKPIV